MEFIELVKNRYSERNFSNQEIKKEDLDKILEVDRLVPTACNYQPQRFYVIKSKEGFEKLKKARPAVYNANVVILVCYDINVVWKNPKDQMYDNYNAGEQDCSIAATSMMYEAAELGIHSLWIRGFDSKAVVDAFDLPNNIIPVMMLALGYPSKDSKPSDWHYKRNNIDSFVKEI